MQVKNGIAGRGVRIEARITAPRVVPACVSAIERLADGAEAFEIVAAGRELVLHVGGTGVGGPDGGDVAFEAARVVSKTVAVEIGVEGCWAEVDGEGSLSEGTLLDAATSCGGWDDEIDAKGGEVGGSVVGDEFAVAAYGSGRAIEDSAVGGVLPGEGPVPVGLGAFVTAFRAESLFVKVDVVAVKGVE